MNFYLGCAIWAYKEWVGDLFPVGSRSNDFLRLYSRRFTAVEGNTTFYATPDLKMMERWVTETPPSFQFCLKLPRTITHSGLLTPAIPATAAFLQQMQPLRRLGPYFAQLPPSYSPDNLADLTQFLQAFPHQAVPLTLEVRHPDWFRSPHAEDLEALLADLNIGRVLLDTRPIYDCPDDPQLASERRKPRVPLQVSVTSDVIFVRYISHPDRDWNQRYFEEWVTQIQPWLTQGKQVYFFVHCPVEVHSPQNARSFYHLLQQSIDLPPLLWDAIEAEPTTTQLTLFE